MTRLSIVIPCYNDGAYLGEAVASALTQDHSDCEVIVADDGSSDAATLRELKAAEGHGVRVLRLAHRGVSATRNTAVESATGEYILPLDADDLLTSSFAGLACEVLDSDPAAGIVGSSTEFFGTRSGIHVPKDPHPADWLVANQLPVSAVYRREDWRRCGGYAADLSWGEDWHLWVQIIALGRSVRLLPTVGLRYRRRPGQVTTRVAWEVQEVTRKRVIRAGIPIIARYPEDSSTVLGQQLNQLQALRRPHTGRRWRRVLQALHRR